MKEQGSNFLVSFVLFNKLKKKNTTNENKSLDAERCTYVALNYNH